MKLRNIRKTYHNRNNDVQALKGISLDLDTNGITVILGPSSCGKTTLMKRNIQQVSTHIQRTVLNFILKEVFRKN